MTAIPAAATVPAADVAEQVTVTGTHTDGAFSFRTLLGDLNPLQYIPVVGSIYRGITGDEGNATLRFVASLGTSFALGGPVSVGITVAEKVTGIDPEKIALHWLGRLLHPHQKQAATSGAAAPQTAASRPATTGDAATKAAVAAPSLASPASGGSASGTTSGAALAASTAPSSSRPWSKAELAAYGVRETAQGELSAGSSTGADVLNGLELKRLSARA